MAHADKVISELSQYISRELELVIGSEEVIKIRQQVIAERTIAASQASEYYHKMMCGSMSEGFRLRGQDLDVMVVMKQIPVYDNQSKIPTEKFCVRLLYGACYTGVMLEVFSYKNHNSEDLTLKTLNICCNKYKQRHVLNASKCKRIFYDVVSSGLTPAKITGPVANELKVLESTIAFQTNFWPKCAHEWINRNRKYNWPCKTLIQFIVTDVGCNIVPTYDVPSQEQDLLWRLSFSRAETILVSQLSSVQYKVFAMMKILLKCKINEGIEEEQKFLTSYHIKNTIFHMAETLPSPQLTGDKLLDRFWGCLNYLRKSLQQDFLPHYFLTGLNLYAKHWNKDNKETALHRIDQCFRDQQYTIAYFISVLQAEWKLNLNQFGEPWFKTLLDKEFVKDSSIWDRTVFENKQVGLSWEKLYSVQKLKKACSKFRQNKSVTLCRGNLDIITSQLVTKSLDCLKLSEACVENKKTYFFSRLAKQLLLVCCNADISRGWLTLAFYYFQISDFKKCKHICKKAISSQLMWFRSQLGDDKMHMQHYIKELTENHLDIFQKLKIANIFKAEFNLICPQEFDQELSKGRYDEAHITQILYASILLFSSCNRLGDVPGCLTAVWELKREAQLCSSNNYLINTALLPKVKAPIMCCIGVCYEILGDEVKAKLNFVKAIDILPQYTPAINRFRRLLKRSSIVKIIRTFRRTFNIIFMI